MNQEDINSFARLLENAGYEKALRLIQDELIPLAKKKGISLRQAAIDYSDTNEEQDTSWYQLHLALTEIPKSELESLNINEPL